ncbi:uncharacterized protein [Maniola hyperantus]|uniref:uncharacterized protein n=3 Tax=Aphantopus hyperantus TaxID=2795564 RepID=UPI003749B3FE
MSGNAPGAKSKKTVPLGRKVLLRSVSAEDPKPSGSEAPKPSGGEAPASKASSQSSPTPSVSSRASSGEPTQAALSTLPAAANRLLQEAKEQMEQSGNLKTSIKEKVLENLAGLYEIVLRLSESRQTLQLQLERARSQATSQALSLEKQQTARLEELVEGVKAVDIRAPIAEVLSEVKSLRQIVNFDVLDALSKTSQQQPLPLAMEITKRLNEASSQLAAVVEESRRSVTYAEVAAGPKPKSIPNPNHSIIVSSKDEKDTSDDVLKRIRGAADARASGVRVERIRKARNQKVVISCESKDSLTRLTDKLKVDDCLQINEAKNKDPLIVIKNMLSYNTDDEVVASIKTQNADALVGIPDSEYRVVPKYRRPARNPHECHMVMQVSPKVWQRLTSQGRVHIDLQRCFVLDQSPLVQCTRCLGFGHSRRLCKEAEDRCSHCAGPHLRSTCPSWTVGDVACCRNCHIAKLERTEHSAFDLECPIRKKWDTIARSSANLQRKKLATQELLKGARDSGVDVSLIQEPYVGAEGIVGQYSGTRVIQKTKDRGKPVKAAILVHNQNWEIHEDPFLTTENIAYVAIKTKDRVVNLISAYLEEDQPLEPYLEHLRKIITKKGSSNIIFGGDVNAWSTWWGSSEENHRGAELASFLDELDLQILNDGSEPTFLTVRNNKIYSSRVDITTCSVDLLGKVDGWTVDQGFTSSDHNTIKFNLQLEKPTTHNKTLTTRQYFTNKAKWTIFKKELDKQLKETDIDKTKVRQILNKKDLDELVGKYVENVINACNRSIPKLKPKDHFKLPWWTAKLELLKREVTTKKRRIRCAAPSRRAHVVKDYVETKQIYEEEAKHAQTTSWKQFCTKQDRESLWDGVYRVIRSTQRRTDDKPMVKDGVALSPADSAEYITSTFFPDDNVLEDTPKHTEIRGRTSIQNDGGIDDPYFTETELQHAVNSFNPKKAPGSDGLTADICTAAINHDPGLFLSIANKCLELSLFPSLWKVATIVVLRKPGKTDYNHPKSYRPIGLLSIFGKILEKMLISRLKYHILPKLNTRQYGFVPQRSTEDALCDLVNHIREQINNKNIVTLVSLDIEGAFDSAWWPAIKDQLHKMNCPKNLKRLINSYFENRQVQVTYAGKTVIKPTTKGCVQGSIGGPIFWNLLLNPLLNDLDKKGVYCQAFADDVVLVFSGKDSQSIQNKANETLDLINAWGAENKLKFAAQKTHAMILTKKLKYQTPNLKMNGTEILLTKEIKILGLTIDEKLTFNKHVANTAVKALNIYKQLARTARTTWGLNPEVIRTIYVAVIEPIVMYAASVWAKAAEKITVQKQLNTIQRGFAQKICKSYRTVSLHAALVLAGLIPLDLRISEHAQLYEAKRGRPLRCLPEDRKLEERISFLEAEHPAETIAVDYSNLEDLQPETVEAHNLQGTLIFTDGSKIEDKVGAAISIWKDGKETASMKLRLEPYCTVFQAELFALRRAIEKFSKGKDDEVCILSDSRSSLDLLRNHRSFHPLAFAIRKQIANLRQQGKEIRLYWIKAHVGIEGNERADELAKQAALHKKSKADYDACPVSYVKRQIRQATLDVWQKRYSEGDTANTTKAFLPDVRNAYKIIRTIKLDSTTTQVLSGHGGFAYYLHKFKCKASPSCQCDPEVNEDILHLLLDCPRFAKIRFETEILLDDNITLGTINKFLENKDKRDIFLKFCKYIAEKIIRQNK